MTDPTYEPNYVSPEEAAELDTPAPEVDESYEIATEEEGPAVEEDDEVTEDNFEDYLPPEGEEGNDLDASIDEQNEKLTPEAQEAYQQDPPDPQESWTEGEPV